MEFKDVLKKYMDILSVRPKKLAHESDIAALTIEEFLEGRKVPKPGSTQLESLINVIENMVDEAENVDIPHSDILYDFMTAVSHTKMPPEPVSEKITSILRTLHVSPKDLAKGIGCTPFFLEQLRNDNILPEDPEDFADRLSSFLTENYSNETGADKLSNVIGISASALRHAERARVEIRDWFLDGVYESEEDGNPRERVSSKDVEPNLSGSIESIRNGLHHVSPETIACGKMILGTINSRSSKSPMVQLYQNMGREELETILASDFKTTSRQLTLRNSLPVASMPQELLDRILFRNKVQGIQRMKTMEFYDFVTRHAAERYAMAPHFGVIPRLDRETFEKNPIALELDEDSISKRLVYTFEEYQEHLKYFEEYVANTSNLTVVYADHLDYPDLAIRVRAGECVIITRSCDPKMNLIVSEPHICDMFEEYISLILLGKA